MQAAPLNEEYKQAVCRKARCLTLQSRGHAPASRVTPLISTLGIAEMQMQTRASVWPTGRQMQKAEVPAKERAVRPLAASARPERFATDSSLCSEPAFGRDCACSVSIQAVRRSAKPNARSRIATSFACGGGAGLLAGGATQRKIQAGRVPRSALPNPSIERTNTGGPGLLAFASAQPPVFASHLKR